MRPGASRTGGGDASTDGSVSRRDFFSLGARRVLPGGGDGDGGEREALAAVEAGAAARAAGEKAAQAAWSHGDLAIQARALASAADVLVAAARVAPADRVLDVGAGDGTLALAAARAGAQVTALDANADVVAAGRARCAAADVRWEVGDARRLPFADAAFDCCLSNFGAIFAEQPRQVAAELARVTRPGGVVGLTAWAPGGLMGRVLELAARLAPPPAGAARPARWGRFESVFLLMDRVVDALTVTDLELTWTFPTVEAARDALAAAPGPLGAALEDAPEDARRAALGELATLVGSFAVGDPGGVRLAVGYSVVSGTA